jgi:hypothetical protein
MVGCFSYTLQQQLRCSYMAIEDLRCYYGASSALQTVIIAIAGYCSIFCAA